MEFKELIAGFAAKYGIEGLSGADGAAELEVDGIRVELLEDPQARSLIACAEIGLPPPDANGAFGSMMLKANFLLRATEGATLCENPESSTAPTWCRSCTLMSRRRPTAATRNFPAPSASASRGIP